MTQVYDPVLDAWSLGSEMPKARTGLYVFAIDDLFYSLGGGIIWGTEHNFALRVSSFNVNEAYFPVGYGTPDPSYIPPTPTPTPNTQPDGIQVELILILCVLIIATVAVVFGYIFKRKQCGLVR